MVIYHCGLWKRKKKVCVQILNPQSHILLKRISLILVERHLPGHIYSYFSTSESTEVQCSVRSVSQQVHRMQELPLYRLSA